MTEKRMILFLQSLLGKERWMYVYYLKSKTNE